METTTEEYTQKIASIASDELSKRTVGVAFIALEQGGVKLTDESLQLPPELQARITNLLGITELITELRHSLFEQALKSEITDQSKLYPDPVAIPNQETFVQDLLGKSPKLLEKLAEITAKASVCLTVLQDTPQHPKVSAIKTQMAAWKSTIDAVASSLCANETTEQNFYTLVQNNISLLRTASEKQLNPTNPHGKKNRGESYAEKFTRLLQIPRAVDLIAAGTDAGRAKEFSDKLIDEYLETAFTLNAVKVLHRIQSPLTLEGKVSKLFSCLRQHESDPIYLEIIQNNGIAVEFAALGNKIKNIKNAGLLYKDEKQQIQDLNAAFKEKCTTIVATYFENNPIDEEVIDLVSTKQKLRAFFLQSEALRASGSDSEESKGKITKLDEQMQELMIQIANKIARIFPHKTSTNLIDVIENSDAICAGKVNILLAVSKYLDLNARANSVREMMIPSNSGHVCLECDLPSGKKLVIDADSSNKNRLESASTTDLIALIRKNSPGITDQELKSALRYYDLAIPNASSIPSNARIVLYTTEETDIIAADADQIKKFKNTPYHFIRQNPYSGIKEVWKASIPYPHHITLPDRDGYFHINSSFTNNSGHFLARGYTELGLYLFKKHLAMNPYDVKAYKGIGGLLPKTEMHTFFAQVKKEQPSLYWDGISVEHAVLCAYNAMFDTALEIFEQTKAKSPLQYYNNLWQLSLAIRNTMGTDEYQNITKRKSKVRSLLQEAKNANPTLFFSNLSNPEELLRLYDAEADKEIAILEELKKNNPNGFWDEEHTIQFFQKLLKLYAQKGSKDISQRSTAEKMAEEIKNKLRAWYDKGICNYVSELYLHGSIRDPDQALLVLQESKTHSPATFFSKPENCNLMIRIYEAQKDFAGAIAFCNEVKQQNPNLFWTYQYTPIHEVLAGLQVKTGLIDTAIHLFEEAKSKNKHFWTASYNGGYAQLVKLYAATQRIPEALALCTEAQTKDPKFMSSESGYGGYVQLAELFDLSGRTSDAIELLLEAQHTDTRFWQREYLNPNVFKLVEYYTKTNQLAEAIDFLEQLKVKNPNYLGTDYYTLCELYEKNGQHAEAIQCKADLLRTYEALSLSNPNVFKQYAAKVNRLKAIALS